MLQFLNGTEVYAATALTPGISYQLQAQGNLTTAAAFTSESSIDLSMSKLSITSVPGELSTPLLIYSGPYTNYFSSVTTFEILSNQVPQDCQSDELSVAMNYGTNNVTATLTCSCTATKRSASHKVDVSVRRAQKSLTAVGQSLVDSVMGHFDHKTNKRSDTDPNPPSSSSACVSLLGGSAAPIIGLYGVYDPQTCSSSCDPTQNNVIAGIMARLLKVMGGHTDDGKTTFCLPDFTQRDANGDLRIASWLTGEYSVSGDSISLTHVSSFGSANAAVGVPDGGQSLAGLSWLEPTQQTRPPTVGVFVTSPRNRAPFVEAQSQKGAAVTPGVSLVALFAAMFSTLY